MGARKPPMMTGFQAEENLTGRAPKNVRKILDVINSPFFPHGKEGVFRAAPETAGEAAGLTDWAYGISHMEAAIRTDLNGTLCVATKK